jgi:hypothetical protein
MTIRGSSRIRDGATRRNNGANLCDRTEKTAHRKICVGPSRGSDIRVGSRKIPKPKTFLQMTVQVARKGKDSFRSYGHLGVGTSGITTNNERNLGSAFRTSASPPKLTLTTAARSRSRLATLGLEKRAPKYSCSGKGLTSALSGIVVGGLKGRDNTGAKCFCVLDNRKGHDHRTRPLWRWHANVVT